jgi:hypothetical protein
MHPVTSEFELRVHDRRRQELIVRAQRDREVSALLERASSPRGSRAPHRRATDGWSSLAWGWLSGWRAQARHAHPTRSTA